MKLAFSTLGCPSWNFEKAVEEAGKLGFAGIEVRGIGRELDTAKLPCFLPENRARTRRLLKKAGVSVCCAGTSCAFDDDAKIPRALAEGRTAVDVCARMGIPFLRVFGNGIPAGERPETAVRRVAGGIARLCAYAESASGVGVLLEVHGDFNTVERLSAVAELLRGHPSFGLLWDIQHSHAGAPGSDLAFYRSLKPLIRHVHIKDCRRENGKEVLCLPGEGGLPVREIVRELLKDGYGGYFSFEWEKRWHPELEEPETAFPRYAEWMRGIPE